MLYFRHNNFNIWYPRRQFVTSSQLCVPLMCYSVLIKMISGNLQNNASPNYSHLQCKTSSTISVQMWQIIVEVCVKARSTQNITFSTCRPSHCYCVIFRFRNCLRYSDGPIKDWQIQHKYSEPSSVNDL